MNGEDVPDFCVFNAYFGEVGDGKFAICIILPEMVPAVAGQSAVRNLKDYLESKFDFGFYLLKNALRIKELESRYQTPILPAEVASVNLSQK